MTSKDFSVSDLTFLLKMAPLLRELDTVDRIYRLLLAMVTAGRDAGFPKAFIFIVDEMNGVVRGRFGAERPPARREGKTDSFDDRTRRVFSVYEGIESSDITLKSKSFSVPLAWHRSGLVKASRSAHPVLAERQATEFATDPLFDFFNINRYLAIPIKLNHRVAAVIAVEAAKRRSGSVDDVSLLYSLTQQAGAAAQSLITIADHRRRARIVWKIQQSLQDADTVQKLDEALRLAAIMVSRAVRSSGALIKDYVRQKTVHIKTVREDSPEADDNDTAIGECLDEILDRSAGTVRPISGDGGHPQVTREAAETLDFFHAVPLRANADVSGAIAVYSEKADDPRRKTAYSPDDQHFVALCAGVIAATLESHQLLRRIERAEEVNQELSSNLARERERSRLAEISFDYHLDVASDLDALRKVLSKKTPYAKRFPEITRIVRDMQERAQKHVAGLTAPESGFVMVDIFDVTRRAAQELLDTFQDAGVELTTRIPPAGPKLLMDEKRIALAIRNIISATGSFLNKGNKMLIECSSSDDRVLLCFADNGSGVPGDTISRLLMPFEAAEDTDDRKRALSLAGEIIEKHGGDILVKSSMSWRTILILSFPKAANRDRRKSSRDRRRRADRRLNVGT